MCTKKCQKKTPQHAIFVPTKTSIIYNSASLMVFMFGNVQCLYKTDKKMKMSDL